jgi:hypothetical protein
MNELNKPPTRTYFAAYGPVGTTHIGITEPDQVTTSGQPSFDSDSDPEAFAAKIESADLTDSLPTLPNEGEQVEKDVVYNYNGKAVVCYQSHIRTHYDPSETPALFGLAKAAGDPWVQPKGAHDAYKFGAIVTRNGKTWKCTATDANGNNVWAPGVFGWTEI